MMLPPPPSAPFLLGNGSSSTQFLFWNAQAFLQRDILASRKKVDLVLRLLGSASPSVLALQEVHGNSVSLHRALVGLRQRYRIFSSFLQDGSSWHAAGGVATVVPIIPGVAS